MFKNTFPWILLDNWPTPIHRLKRFGQLIGHDNLFMKRDDISLVGLGGNKVRKLEYWLGEARARQCDIIVVAGEDQSNLVRLTAAACAKTGLECLAVHNSVQPDLFQGNALLNRLFKAKSVYLGEVSEEERHTAALDLLQKLQQEGRKPYYINQEFVGTLGYTQCVQELSEQNYQQNLKIKNIVIVGAMGITASGFIYGNSLLTNPFRIHVISVEFAKPKLDQIIAQKVEQLQTLTGRVSLHNYLDFTTTYDEYMGEGWGKPTDSSLQMIHTLAAAEGILIDHVYNAKTVDGLAGLVDKGIIKADESTCIIHTGGVPSLFGYAELIQTYPELKKQS